jgi:hypothetical protein
MYLFNVWDAIEHNEVCRITRETVAGFFPDNPPQFYTVPFGLHDHETIWRLLTRAGFERVQHEVVGTPRCKAPAMASSRSSSSART